ncbi:hypothetical protein NL676_006701 [Syzygium grande]|nr:hypothetical protein NL676_006701 [Syzygium grande]
MLRDCMHLASLIRFLQLYKSAGEIPNLSPDDVHSHAGFLKHLMLRTGSLKFGAANYTERDAEIPEKYVSRPECYNLQISEHPSGAYGVHSYHGCPGFHLQYATLDQEEEIYGRNKSSGIFTETTATAKFRITRVMEDCC